MNSYQAEYWAVWKEAFAKFLGWTEKQTFAWAKPHLDGMDPPGMVINEPPFYWVADFIISSQPYYDNLSHREKDDLTRRVEDVLSSYRYLRNFPPDYDFDAAKARVQEILDARGRRTE